MYTCDYDWWVKREILDSEIPKEGLGWIWENLWPITVNITSNIGYSFRYISITHVNMHTYMHNPMHIQNFLSLSWKIWDFSLHKILPIECFHTCGSSQNILIGWEIFSEGNLSLIKSCRGLCSSFPFKVELSIHLTWRKGPSQIDQNLTLQLDTKAIKMVYLKIGH